MTGVSHGPFGIIVLASGRGTRLGGRDKPSPVAAGPEDLDRARGWAP